VEEAQNLCQPVCVSVTNPTPLPTPLLAAFPCHTCPRTTHLQLTVNHLTHHMPTISITSSHAPYIPPPCPSLHPAPSPKTHPTPPPPHPQPYTIHTQTTTAPPHLVTGSVVAALLAGVHPAGQQLAACAATHGGLLITLEVRVQRLATGAVPLTLLGTRPTTASMTYLVVVGG